MTETTKQQLLAIAADLRRQAEAIHRHSGYTDKAVARFFAADTALVQLTADRLEHLARDI